MKTSEPSAPHQHTLRQDTVLAYPVDRDQRCQKRQSAPLSTSAWELSANAALRSLPSKDPPLALSSPSTARRRFWSQLPILRAAPRLSSSALASWFAAKSHGSSIADIRSSSKPGSSNSPPQQRNCMQFINFRKSLPRPSVASASTTSPA